MDLKITTKFPESSEAQKEITIKMKSSTWNLLKDSTTWKILQLIVDELEDVEPKRSDAKREFSITGAEQEIHSNNCGRDKNGAFHCECGECTAKETKDYV